MAAPKPIYKNPVFIVATLSVLVAGYFLTEPEATRKSGSGKAVTKKKPTVKVGIITFNEEDETASFERAKTLDKNAFKPVIARTNGIGGADGRANALPTDITGGEANWVYTGNAEIDGVPHALLENRATNDGVFLKRGERWKSATVVSIRENSIVFRGPSGTRTFTTVDDDPGIPRASSGTGQIAQNQNPQGGFNQGRGNNNNNGFSPMNPGMRGPIGQLPGVSANGAAAEATFGDGSVIINGN